MTGEESKTTSIDIEELQRRLEEAEQTIEAIRRGEVDAIVRPGEEGLGIYTLESGDHPYRNIVETMNAGAVTIDEDYTVYYSNAVFSEMTGIPLQSLIGSNFKSLIVPEDLPLFLGFVKKSRKGKRAIEEVTVKRKNGSVFVRLAGSNQTIYNIERTSIVITDISDLRAAQESFRKEARTVERERDRLMTLINSMNDGVWFVRSDGRVVLANAVAKAQSVETGIDPDTLSQLPALSFLSQVDLLTSNLTPLDFEPLLEVFAGKPFHGVEVAVRNRATGETFFRRISANPIWDEERRVEGVIVVVQDFTAERRAGREKAQLQEQLQQAQKMEAIGTLAGGIAHDFNNMLAVVLGNAELALDEVHDDNGATRNLDQIIKASKRARDLVRQILTFSRKTEQGRTQLQLTPLIKETYTLLRGTLPSTIRMELEVDTETDAVFANPSQMQQVIMNLATNAAHAMREKGGVLTIGLTDATFDAGALPTREMSAGTYIKLTVRDTGTGMTDDVRRRIFEPFFTTKQAGEGTGMGLSVVYGIVNSHDGAITIESKPSKGSTFNIFLPFAGEQRHKEAQEKGDIPAGTERILVVDDEPSVVEMTREVLKRLGYSVSEATSGNEALELFLRDPRRFDAVITDHVMPEMSGVDLAKNILRIRKDIPIVLFTGYSETVSPEKAKEAGIREFIMKPIAKREMAQTLRRALDAYEGSRREPADGKNKRGDS